VKNGTTERKKKRKTTHEETKSIIKYIYFPLLKSINKTYGNFKNIKSYLKNLMILVGKNIGFYF